MKGEHLYVTPSSPTSAAFEVLISTLLSSVSETLEKPVCFALTPFDARSELVRTKETGLGNWVADVLLHAYAESGIEGGSGFVQKSKDGEKTEKEGEGNAGKVYLGNGEKSDKEGDDHGADIVLLCGGTLRGDSQYGPGKITLGDILGELFIFQHRLVGRAHQVEILPFEDPVVCIEVSRLSVSLEGKLIPRSMERVSGKSWKQHYPNGPPRKGEYSLVDDLCQDLSNPDRRFPIVAGLAVQWDHTLPPNQRIKSIHLIKNPVGDEDTDEIEHPGDMVNFVEQEDGTRVEVNQRGVDLGDEVKRDGSRVYRVVSLFYRAVEWY